MLRVSDDLSLPIEAVTATIAILAQKRKGKSYTASVYAEELLEAQQQVVVLDPTGAWWGLRSSADGKGEGYPIAVLGGEHGDVPLEASAGAVIAQAVATEHFSCIIDTSLFTKGEELRFLAPFLETLYRKNRTPLHLFIDEADAIAPQRPMGEDARTLGACQNIVRRGGIRGIGCTMITQRPQVLNKDVLSQAEALCVLSMNHPKDLGAIDEWVRVHADPARAKEMIASLPKLPVGRAWWWWPMREVFCQATTRKRHTFDSGATPKPGQTAPQAKVLAQVDIARLGKQIAATVAEAKESDPKALRAEVQRLKAELAREKESLDRSERERDAGLAQARRLIKDQDAIIAELRAQLEASPKTVAVMPDLADLHQMAETLAAAVKRLMQRQGMDMAPTNGARARFEAELERARTVPRVRGGEANPPPAAPVSTSTSPGNSLPKAQRAILTVLAQHHEPCSKAKVAIIAGYAVNGGGFNNALSRLRTEDWIRDGRDGDLEITPRGRQALGAYDPLPPSGAALRDHWYRTLGKAEREVIRILAVEGASPKEYVAIRAGYAANGGGFNNALSRLRTLGLIEGKAKLSLAPEIA